MYCTPVTFIFLLWNIYHLNLRKMCTSWSLTSYYHGPMFVYKTLLFCTVYSSFTYAGCVCVCVCVHVHMHACVHVCMCIMHMCGCGYNIYMHALVVTTIPHCYIYNTHDVLIYIYAPAVVLCHSMCESVLLSLPELPPCWPKHRLWVWLLLVTDDESR